MEYAVTIDVPEGVADPQRACADAVRDHVMPRIAALYPRARTDLAIAHYDGTSMAPFRHALVTIFVPEPPVCALLVQVAVMPDAAAPRRFHATEGPRLIERGIAGFSSKPHYMGDAQFTRAALDALDADAWARAWAAARERAWA